MKIITALPLFTSCTLAVILACNALFCNPCEQTQCPDVQDCPVGTVMEPCGCCEVCAIPEGESCNTMEFGLCADEKFCLPDGGLSSGAITGKCLGMSIELKYFSLATKCPIMYGDFYSSVFAMQVLPSAFLLVVMLLVISVSADIPTHAQQRYLSLATKLHVKRALLIIPLKV